MIMEVTDRVEVRSPSHPSMKSLSVPQRKQRAAMAAWIHEQRVAPCGSIVKMKRFGPYLRLGSCWEEHCPSAARPPLRGAMACPSESLIRWSHQMMTRTLLRRRMRTPLFPWERVWRRTGFFLLVCQHCTWPALKLAQSWWLVHSVEWTKEKQWKPV